MYLQDKIYQKIFIGSLIFSPKLAISTIFLPKSHVVFPLGKLKKMNCSTKVSLCQTIFYINSMQQWFQKINLTYICIYKYVSTKIGTIIVCCLTVCFWLALDEPNKFGHGIAPYNIPPLLGFSSTFSMIQASGSFLFQNQRASAIPVLSYFGLVLKQTCVTPRSFWYIALPRIYSVVCIFG